MWCHYLFQHLQYFLPTHLGIGYLEGIPDISCPPIYGYWVAYGNRKCTFWITTDIIAYNICVLVIVQYPPIHYLYRHEFPKH